MNNEEVLHLARDLIAIDSTVDTNPEKIIGIVIEWLRTNDIPHEILKTENTVTGIAITPPPNLHKNSVCLNACLDTAHIGDPEEWEHPPFSGVISNGWLHGRGAADSKIALSIFLHLAKNIHQGIIRPKSAVYFLFDAYEHDGSFQGIKSFQEKHPDVTEFVIGYPGNKKIHIGARGFARCELIIKGDQIHSGSSKIKNNPIHKFCHIITGIRKDFNSISHSTDYPIPPEFNVTKIVSGTGYNQIPGCLRAWVDFRIAGVIDFETVQSIVHKIAKEYGGVRYIWGESWPAYILNSNMLLVQTLKEAAESVYNTKILLAPSGPSNIGNYLFSLGSSAICGFGVNYKNIHAPNECIEIATIAPTVKVFKKFIENYQ